MTTILRDLDPRAVAREACAAAVEHLGRVLFVLQPAAAGLVVGAGATSPERLVDGSDLGLTVQALTAFAQRGAPVGDWTHAELAADGLLTVVGALYGGALDGEDATPGILSEGEPSSPLEAVLLAAWTRVQFARGEAVDARQLACLASCPTRTVRHHIESGELTAAAGRPARVAPEEARRWLSARGVKA